MKKTPLVSIVVPVYNAEKFLEDTINCVLNQTYDNWELLLINDCSKDNSKKVAKQFLSDKIKWIDMKKNGGPALTRNKGIDESKGKYICFLDADDLWEEQKLEKQVKFMQEKKCAFSYTSYEFADEQGIPIGKKVIAKEIMTYHKNLKNTIISTITVMFDVTIIDKNMIKMPNLKWVEDTATWWQILRNGYVAYGLPNVYSYYRRSNNTHSSNKIRTLKQLLNLYIKVEKLNVFYAIYCFVLKNINALLRRI